MTRGIGGHGSANIMKHLKGLKFPADKSQIVNQAKSGPGPDTSEVVDVLNRIDDKEYSTPAAIMHEVGKIE